MPKSIRLYRSVYGNGHTPPGKVNRAYVRYVMIMKNTFTVDTQLQSDFATGAVGHTLLTGVDYSRMRNDVERRFGYGFRAIRYAEPAAILILRTQGVNFPIQVLNRMEQTGLYAQDQMAWDKWVMTLGGRYDYAMASTRRALRIPSPKITISSSPGAAVLTICLIMVSRHTSATANRLSRFPDRRGMANPSILPTANSMKPA
jgi:outer membrane receptor for monomeric catechols